MNISSVAITMHDAEKTFSVIENESWNNVTLLYQGFMARLACFNFHF